MQLWVEFDKMLPFRLTNSNPLHQLCEDPLLICHSKETSKQKQCDKTIHQNRFKTNLKSACERRWWPHQVAFEADKVDSHWDGSVGVAAQSFNPLHQVGTELVASFQNTQHHNLAVSQVIHDVSGQTFRPVHTAQVAQGQLQAGLTSCF